MKKIFSVKLTVLAAIFYLSVMPTLAAEQDQKMNYARVNVGFYQPTGHLDDNNYDTGANLSLSYGRYLTRYFSVEAGLDSFAVDNDFISSNITAGTYTQENVMSGHGLTFTLKGEYSSGPVRLYAGGGFGLYTAILSTEIDTSNQGDFDKSDSDFIVGAHIVAGLDYDINDRWFVNVGGRYRITEDVNINKTVASVPVTYRGDLDGHSVTVGCGFRF